MIISLENLFGVFFEWPLLYSYMTFVLVLLLAYKGRFPMLQIIDLAGCIAMLLVVTMTTE